MIVLPRSNILYLSAVYHLYRSSISVPCSLPLQIVSRESWILTEGVFMTNTQVHALPELLLPLR